MKLLVDTKDPQWRAERNELWESHYANSFQDTVPGDRCTKEEIKAYNAQVQARKSIYMGDVVSLDDPLIETAYSDMSVEFPFECFQDAFFLNPHQCEENWLWMIDEGWRQWTCTSKLRRFELHKSTRFELFKSLFSVIVWNRPDIIKDWGDDHELFEQFFNLLAGSRYDPEHYTFNGEYIGKHPLKPHDILKKFCANLYLVIIGSSSFEEMWIKEYDYAVQAFAYVNPDIFDPVSKLEDNCDAKLKNEFAGDLKVIYFRERKFDELRKKGRLDSYWEDKTADEWRQSDVIHGLVSRFEQDMVNGTFPEPMKRLYHWAAAEAANTIELNHYTRFDKVKFKDPWKVKASKNETASKNKNSSPPKAIVLEPEVEGYVCRELETYRKLACEGDMTGYDFPFDSFKSYAKWRKAKTAIARNKLAKEFQSTYKHRDDYVSNLFISYIHMLFPRYIAEIPLDVFGAFEPGDINREYRSAWKALTALAKDHVTINAIKTRKKGGAESGYDITVTVVTDRQEHVFNYVKDSDWLDESILSDINVFAEAEELPWRFSWDDGDNAKFVMYLPAVFGGFPQD